MGLSNKREEQLKRMPNIESTYAKSQDGKYLIHRTTITTVRPVAYMEKVLDDTSEETSEVEVQSGEEISA